MDVPFDVYLEPWSEPTPEAVTRALQAVGRWDDVGRGTKVFLKPNFTFPFFKPGVTTPPDMISTVARTLVERGAQVRIGEGGPSNDVFCRRGAFEEHGLSALRKELGVEVVDLRDAPTVPRTFGSHGSGRDVPIPRLLLEDTDLFLNLPVAKVHSMTWVSLSIKNHWGLIPELKRYKRHPAFDEIVTGISEFLPLPTVLCDGRYLLTDNGPMFGTLVEGSFLAAARTFGGFDLALCDLMEMDPRKAAHLRHGQRTGAVPTSLGEIRCNRPPRELSPGPFRLRRTLQNYIALSAFHSRLITWLGYDSPVEGFFHRILYALNGGNPLVRAMEERGCGLEEDGKIGPEPRIGSEPRGLQAPEENRSGQ